MSESNITVKQVSLPGQQTYGGSVFPLVWKCDSQEATLEDSVAWARQHRAELDEQASKNGAVLFRGFPLNSPEDLDQFIAAFELENFPYEQSLSNAVRVNFTPRVFSANEAPSEVRIFLHHEMAQTPVFPSKLFFFCLIPADEGGATPLCRSDVLFEQMLRECPEFAKNCEQRGLQYTNVMPGEDDAASGLGRSWQSTFRSESREEAESRMRELNYSWEWMDDGCLRATTPVLPAVIELADGRKAFFNQLIAAFQGWKDSRNDPEKAIKFGDGSSLDRSDVMKVAEMAEALTFDVPWQKGDVALVDNFVAMHGRRSFVGTRKILASLVASKQHASVS